MDFIFLILPALIKGAKLSVIITLQAGILAIFISIFVGIIRLSENFIVRLITGSYVEFFRGTSAFVQIYWAYFALPMIGIKISAITAGILVLSLNVGAYGSEVVRGGLKAINVGQIEASKSLGLPRIITYWKILLPQAMVRIILPMGNLMIDLLKGTSLLSVITVTDLAFAGRQLISSFGNPLLIFGLVLFIYLILALPLSLGSKFLYKYLYNWKTN
tara:strand:- start:845 stop:1495 length:651 start_codon:yes stop_codon:yes gene_type:complete